MTDRTITEAPREAASILGRGTDRAVVFAALGGIALLFAAAGLLWWREGLGVFVEVILSGLAACF